MRLERLASLEVVSAAGCVKIIEVAFDEKGENGKWKPCFGLSCLPSPSGPMFSIESHSPTELYLEAV